MVIVTSSRPDCALVVSPLRFLSFSARRAIRRSARRDLFGAVLRGTRSPALHCRHFHGLAGHFEIEQRARLDALLMSVAGGNSCQAYGGLRAFLAREGRRVRLTAARSRSGVADVGQHYTAMTGMRFVPLSGSASSSPKGWRRRRSVVLGGSKRLLLLV